MTRNTEIDIFLTVAICTGRRAQALRNAPTACRLPIFRASDVCGHGIWHVCVGRGHHYGFCACRCCVSHAVRMMLQVLISSPCKVALLSLESFAQKHSCRRCNHWFFARCYERMFQNLCRWVQHVAFKAVSLTQSALLCNT